MFKLILYLIPFLIGCESAKILGVFPFPSISHQVMFRPLMHELAKRGHEVTVITPDPAFPEGQAPHNLTEIDLHDMSYEHWNNLMKETKREKDPMEVLKSMSTVVDKILERQIKSDEIQNFIKSNKKFDLVFVESFMRPALIFSHIYNAPVIEFGSLGGLSVNLEIAGAVTHPLIYPDFLHNKIYNLTLWEKVNELYMHYSANLLFGELDTESNMLKEVFGPDTPHLKDLIQNVHMYFFNTHPIWDFNRPVPPNVVYLGGLHQKPQRELPKDLKTYLDSSKHGVIYISFGTNVKPSWISLEKLKIFNSVLSKLPYDVLWKWDNDELPGRAKNVEISKWLPQSDLLRHPKIKLFITQGGLQSTDEAITAGVPLIGIPMMGDQPFNVQHYVKFNIGKQLLMQTLTEQQLMDTIETVIDDQSYRRNIVKLRDIINDQPQSPLERAVWWTEHVLRHGGGAHLRAPAAHMSWTDYYEIELVLILLASFVAFAAVIALAMCFILSKIKYFVSGKVKTN